MKKKLTLSIDEEVIKKAKSYAKETDRSLSELIEGYLEKITGSNLVKEPEATYEKRSSQSENKKHEASIYRKMAGIVKSDWDPVEDREKFRDVRLEKYLK
ncbi:DUF6364 family protein [Nonlabens ponticola]|uniref:Uncharacterized protein n=1 Tax=Nonlabens ponticola TaxID=2496866 RepID=A0A3S9MWH4_9FLAO|nr:DUF6364 family protein [Nonlabens ponticola]AZQ43561.1 hypothetical protein EJ995_04680 [Nonlabens ponticola]